LIEYKHICVTVSLVIPFRIYFMALETSLLNADVTAVSVNMVFRDEDGPME